MAKAKKLSTLELVPVMEDGVCIGIEFKGVMSTSDFTDLKEGKEYPVPVKARENQADSKSKLLKEGDFQLYRLKTGGTTTDKQHPQVLTEQRKATAWRGFSKTYTPGKEMVWPEGIPQIRIEAKANDFLQVGEYDAVRKERSTERAAASIGSRVQEMGASQLEALEKQIAEAKAKLQASTGERLAPGKLEGKIAEAKGKTA